MIASTLVFKQRTVSLIAFPRIFELPNSFEGIIIRHEANTTMKFESSKVSGDAHQ